MPPLSIPEPDPKDLQNPVPSTPTPDLSQYFKSIPKAGATPQDSAPDLGQFFPGIKTSSSAAGSQFDENAPSVANIPNDLWNPVTPANGGSAKNAQEMLKNTAQNIKDFWHNFKATLNDDPQKALQSWKNSVGDQNAVLKDGKIYFRNSETEKFRPVTKSTFDGMANFISEHGKMATFLAGALATDGVLAAFSPEIGAVGAAGFAEGAGATAEGVQAASKAAPAALSLTQKIGQAYTPEALGSAAASGAGGGAAEVLGNSAAENASDNPEAPTLGQTASALPGAMVKGAGENMAGHAVVSPAISTLGSGLQKISDLRNGPWIKVQDLYTDLTQSIKDMGIKTPSMDSDTLGRQLGGEKYPEISGASDESKKGIINSIKKKYSDAVGIWVNQAEQASNGRRFSVADQLSKLKGLMQKEGIKFTEKTDTVLEPYSASSEMGFDEFEKMGNQERRVTTDLAVPGSSPYAFGEKNSANVNWMTSFYNDLAKKEALGGLTPAEITNLEQSIGNKAFDNESAPSTRLSYAMRRMSHDLSERQKDVLKEAIGDEGVSGQIDKAYGDYATRIGALRDLVNKFRSSESPTKFADSLVRNDNVEEVAALKFLLEKDAPELWQEVRSNWMANIMTKDPYNEVLNPQKTFEVLFGDNGYQKGVIDQMLPGIEKTKFKASLKELSKIPVQKFTNSQDKAEVLRSAVATIWPSGPVSKGYHVMRLAKNVSNLLKQNGPLADYMAEDGFLKLAEDADNPTDKMNYLEAQQMLQKDLADSEKVYDKKVGFRYQAGTPLSVPIVQSQEPKDKKPATLGQVYGK